MGTLATHTLNSLVLPTLPYDPVRISSRSRWCWVMPNVLLVNPSCGARCRRADRRCSRPIGQVRLRLVGQTARRCISAGELFR